MCIRDSRYQASKLAGLEELPVIIKEGNDEEMLALALIENLQRSDLNQMYIRDRDSPARRCRDRFRTRPVVAVHTDLLH